MQLIRCTKKLQKAIGLKATDLVDIETIPSFLGGWHANLLVINRLKCVLFTNNKTLFNFLITGVKKAQLVQLENLFKSHLQCVLADEGVDESICSKIMQEYSSIGFAKTNSRSILGSMNDLAFIYEYHIQEEGGVGNCLLPSIIRKLNRMPMKGLSYDHPIEALHNFLSKQKTQ